MGVGVGDRGSEGAFSVKGLRERLEEVGEEGVTTGGGETLWCPLVLKKSQHFHVEGKARENPQEIGFK